MVAVVFPRVAESAHCCFPKVVEGARCFPRVAEVPVVFPGLHSPGQHLPVRPNSLDHD